jgi:hypothetical protein
LPYLGAFAFGNVSEYLSNNGDNKQIEKLIFTANNVSTGIIDQEDKNNMTENITHNNIRSH